MAIKGSELKFIDLFAGLGGFHVALQKLGHKCVFASEKKENLANLYSKNFDLNPNRDITTVTPSQIPKHDILCAGFPCQPFSKAGDQKGLNDESNGNLFYHLYEILKYHKPKYFILENVANLAKHDSGNTWNVIYDHLANKLDYSVDKMILSPHQFKIPQHRERCFIVGSLNGLEHFSWPQQNKNISNIFNYLDKNPVEVTKLEEDKIYVLDLWQEFLDRLPKDAKIPSWPIWSMEFGATYPFENESPFASSSRKLGTTLGSYGQRLNGMSRIDKFEKLPSYARTEQLEFPTWKKHYIRSNRAFYLQHKKHINPVVKKLQKLNVSSWQKFEWNVQGGERKVRNYLIQFRGSGVRLKRTNFFPSLVTVSTQIPILGWEERYITPKEGARIQSLNGIKLPLNTGTCFSALGNAVNAKIVKLIAEKLIENTIKSKDHLGQNRKDLSVHKRRKVLQHE